MNKIIVPIVLLVIAYGIFPSQVYAKKKIKLTSSAFEHKTTIPDKFTCIGDNVSPPLKWENIPEKTKSLAIILDDKDSPKITFTHWVIFNILPNLNELPEDVPDEEIVENIGVHGINNFQLIGYDGPCPPSGFPHRYVFKIFALKKELNLEPGVTKKELLRAMRRKIIGRGKLIGVFKR